MNVTVLKNPREKWTDRIAAAWQKQVPSIFEVGALLESAKTELKRGEWIAMIKSELPFTRTTATRLMQVATCDHLRNDAHVHHLPANWGTLAELTKLTDEQFNLGIESGAISPKMQRKDVKQLRGINAPQKATGIGKSSIDPVDRCIMRVRALILEWLPEIPSDKHGQLLTELRSEIDSIEQVIDKRAREAK